MAARKRKKACAYCKGRRWVEDEGWEPDFPDLGPAEREPGSGLIPCGGCNFAGWDTPLAPPASTDQKPIKT